METRANYIWVGAVTLALLAMVAAFVIWIARLNEGDRNEYDIACPLCWAPQILPSAEEQQGQDQDGPRGQ